MDEKDKDKKTEIFVPLTPPRPMRTLPISPLE
jgi:hypothetical protein